jgi:putative acetyltransferase
MWPSKTDGNMLREGKLQIGVFVGMFFAGEDCILHPDKHSLPSRSAPVPVNFGNKGQSRSLSSATVFRRGRGPAERLKGRPLVRKNEEKESMNPKIVIRNETPDDVCAITEVTIAAFKNLEISRHTEQFIIEALRADKALTVSLIAEMDGRVVGHIAFSPVTISDGTPNWYGLGPVSVLPEHQRMGIGKALIKEGLSRLKDLNAQGCCLVGHPEYYGKFGFKNMLELVPEGVPQEVFFALSFHGHTPRGTVNFHEGFKADRQEEGAGGAFGRA